MAWGKTEEQKQQEAVAKAKAKAEAAYWKSPVGQAHKARDAGDRFFQVTIGASRLQGTSSDFGVIPSTSSSTTRSNRAPDILGQIEERGWRLEHVGYVFVQTGANSRDKLMSSGDVTSVSGRVEGIYLFRAMPDQADGAEKVRS